LEVRLVLLPVKSVSRVATEDVDVETLHYVGELALELNCCLGISLFPKHRGTLATDGKARLL
jgi:hypothetical protein